MSTIKRGDTITLEGEGERKVCQARKAGPCRGWHVNARHIIRPGDLYVESEPNDTAGGYGWDRVCLAHALSPITQPE